MSFENLPSLEDILGLDFPYKEDYLKENLIKTKDIKVVLKKKNGEKKVISTTFLTEPLIRKSSLNICFDNLYSELEDIYSSYMMNTLSLDVWFEFIKDFKEEIEEYFQTIKNEPYVDQISLLSLKSRKLIQLFYVEYGFHYIEKLVKWKDFCDFKILREIKNYLQSWEFYSKKDVPFMIYDFKIKNWEYFFRYHFDMVRKGYTFHEMVNYVRIKESISFPKPEILSIPDSYFLFFSWKKISLQKNGKEIPLTENIVSSFFHDTSHFEDSTFWFRNHTSYTLFYDNIEQKDDTLYLEHKNMVDFRKGFLECPSFLIPTFFKERMRNFCMKKYPKIEDEIWSFLFSNTKTIFGRDLLKKCFSILGRVSKDYHFYQYHQSLLERIEKKYLRLKYLNVMSKYILFPEYDYQEKKVQEMIKKRWHEIYLFFQDDFFSFLFQENQVRPQFFLETIPFFRFPTQPLLKNIGKENLFEVLNKKKTYLSYFNIENILNIKLQENNTDKISDVPRKKLENYIKKYYDKN